MRWIRRVVFILGLMVVASSCHENATLFAVDTTADTADVNAGDGNCADAGGDCSLRAAIEEANALPGVEKIQLAAATTYVLTAGDLDITNGVVLDGAGANIDATAVPNAIETTHAAGIVELLDLQITAGSAAGVHNSGTGILTVIDTEVSGGTIGIHQTGGTLFLWSSTATGATAAGVQIDAGTAQLQNTTLSGNVGVGLGVSNGTTSLLHATITANAGGVAHTGGSATTTGSIIADQTSGPDCSGTVTSLGHNHESASTCAFTSAGDSGDASALLAPLAANGGPVRTHLPAFASPALNRGLPSGCTTGDVDAIGTTRPVSGRCDKGAVEVSAVGADCQPLVVAPGAQLQNCDLAGASLPVANLAGADLSGADLTGATLVLADLSGAVLDGARLDGATLTDADLATATAAGTSFWGTTLLRTDLTGADLGDALLDGVAASQITTTPASLPPGWALVLQRLVGRGVDLEGVDLTGVDLTGLDMRDVNLDNARLDATTIANTQLAGASVDGIVASNLIGTPASLPTDYFIASGWLVGPGLSFVGADFTGIDFSGRNLTGVTFGASTVINGTDFTGADLSHAVLDGVTALNADLTGATLWRMRGIEVNGEPLLPTGWDRELRILFGPGADLDGVFRGTAATLDGVDLTDALVTNASLNITIQNATLVRTDFTGTVAQNNDFSISDSDATDAIFDDVTFQTFGHPVLERNDFTRASFRNAFGAMTMNENVLQDTDFTGAVFTNNAAWLSQHATAGWGNTGTPIGLPASHIIDGPFLLSVGSDRILRGDASGWDFSGYEIDATWLDATLVGTDFSSSTVDTLDGSDVTNADFSGARLTEVSDSVLSGADFTDADLRDMSGAGNTGVPAALPHGFGLVSGRMLGPWATSDSIAGAALTGLDLTGSDFANRDLSNIVYALGDLRGADLTNADLSGANLFGTRIDDTTLTGATWSNTTCPDGTNTDTNGSASCVAHDPADRWDIVFDPTGTATPLAGASFTLGDSIAKPTLVFVSGTTIVEGPPDNGVDWYIDGVLYRDDDLNAPFEISAASSLPTDTPFNGQGPTGSGNTFLLDSGIHTMEAVAVTPSGAMTFRATFRVDEP